MVKEQAYKMIGKFLQDNAQKEADAISEYTKFLIELDSMKEQLESDSDKKIIENLIEMIEEFVSDELNHQEQLHDTYVLFTGIKTAKD